MALQAIFSFLTYPRKNAPDDPLTPGAELPLDPASKVFSMLNGLFQNAPDDCVIPIRFRADNDDQTNPVREELLALNAGPTVATASAIAWRLQRSTNGQSGIGLMFVCLGRVQGGTRILLSRFPADQGVMAETRGAAFTVKFVEQVFLKSAHSYKAATFFADGRADQLWNGSIIDRQLAHGTKAVADYWVVEFLAAEFATTAAAGTKRLAVALKEALNAATTFNVRREITAAAQLVANIPRRPMSVSAFCSHFNFSEETKAAVMSQVRPARLVADRFRFDATEFSKHLAYRQVELSNGAFLGAPAERFDRVYSQAENQNGVTFTTTGEVVDEKFKKIL